MSWEEVERPQLDEPIAFYLHTSLGSIMIMKCRHPESYEEYPDVCLHTTCDEHGRTVWFCEDLQLAWCDGGPPDYRWHRLRLVPEESEV